MCLMYYYIVVVDMQNKKLRQPNKNTHKELVNEDKKTKQISKQRKINKKVIKKKHEPSAIRLQAINETFHKIQEKSQALIENIELGTQNNNRLVEFLNYKDKVKCKCDKNIKYYCLKCMTKNSSISFPSLELPLSVKVLHHSSQKINKSSIIPISFLSKQITTNFYYPERQQANLQFINSIAKDQGTYVLYPHVQSQKVTEENVGNIKSIVILDCTWFQTDLLLNQMKDKGIHKFIRLDNYESIYWRYNHHNEKALSSAEALMYFMREYQTSKLLNPKSYDSLMFLYLLQLKIIKNSLEEKKIQKQQQQAV